MKELQKLMEYGEIIKPTSPLQDEVSANPLERKTGEVCGSPHRAELTLWDAANRYLHANLPKEQKTLPIAEWEQEYADLKAQREAEYTTLKETRAGLPSFKKSANAWMCTPRRPAGADAPSGMNRRR